MIYPDKILLVKSSYGIIDERDRMVKGRAIRTDTYFEIYLVVEETQSETHISR